jgi:hypothetical protein
VLRRRGGDPSPSPRRSPRNSAPVRGFPHFPKQDQGKQPPETETWRNSGFPYSYGHRRATVRLRFAPILQTPLRNVVSRAPRAMSALDFAIQSPLA